MKTTIDLNKMRELYESGKTFAEVGEAFGFSRSYVHILFKRNGIPARTKQLTRNKPSRIEKLDFDWLKDKPAWEKLDSKVKGEIAESCVKNRLLELGFEVWLSVTPNSKNDMAVLNPKSGTLVKIQVKCATYTEVDSRFRTLLTTKDKNKSHIKYLNEDIDFFVIFCPFVKAFYVLPFSVVAHATSVTVLPHRERFKVVNNYYEKYMEAFDLLCK